MRGVTHTKCDKHEGSHTNPAMCQVCSDVARMGGDVTPMGGDVRHTKSKCHTGSQRYEAVCHVSCDVTHMEGDVTPMKDDVTPTKSSVTHECLAPTLAPDCAAVRAMYRVVWHRAM